MTYNPILPKTELDSLAAERPENTVELFTPNDFYGHASVLKQYCGLDQGFPLPGIYPHGPSLNDKVWDKEIGHTLPFLLLISKQQRVVFSKYCKKPPWIIGSPFYYAHSIIESELEGIKKSATGTVVFPIHSTHHIMINYDINGFIEFLKQLPKENNPITICLGWRDIQLGSHIQYLNEGFNCTTAGHMYDKQFFFRLLKIIAFHKYAITTNYGTSSFYCAAMSLPIIFYKQNIKVQEARQNQPSYLLEETRPAPYLPIVESFYGACKLPFEKMIFKQGEIAKSILGYDSILEPEEMKNLFESLWQRKEMQIFIKKPDYLLEGSLNDIAQTLSKNLTKYPRRTPGKLKIDGNPFAYADLHSFYHQAIQIFGSDLYGFVPDTDSPIILDCGAHIGLASLYFATKYPNAKIHAYEADPAIAKMLIDNVNSFGLRQVAVYSQAVWVHNDGVLFSNSGDDSGYIDNIHQDGKSKVPSVRLRDFLQNNQVDLLKLDIEGAEYDVIMDCDEILSNAKNIIVEVHKFRESDGSLGGLLNTLEKNNFEYTLADLHSADWIESSSNPPFSACKTKNYIITVFAWQKVNSKTEENERASVTKSREDIICRAIEKLNSGKNREAVCLLSQIIEETPSNKKLYYALAIAQARLGNISEAIKTLDNLLTVLPDHKKAKLLLQELRANGNQLRETDIFIASYPRSGNTWLRLLLSDIILQIHKFKTDTVLPIHQDRIIPDIYTNNLYEIDPRIDLPYRLIKTHEKFNPNIQKNICLFRQATDALCSYYYFHRRYQHLRSGVTDGVDAFCKKRLDKWCEHLNSYIQAKTEQGADILFVSYEWLHADTVGALRQATEFLGLPANEQMCRTAVENHTFQKHHAGEKASGNVGSKYSEYFFRKGKIGGSARKLREATLKTINDKTVSFYQRAKALQPIEYSANQ